MFAEDPRLVRNRHEHALVVNMSRQVFMSFPNLEVPTMGLCVEHGCFGSPEALDM